MNAQYKFDRDGNVLSRGIEWCSIFGAGTGFTANPIRGCDHDCHWRMPDGKVVECYAQAFTDRLHGKGAFKNITFHPDVFDKVKKHKQPAGIFFDSMSDMVGNRVEPDWVAQCIQCMTDCPKHVFFVLTKNPRRLTEFKWPDNCLVGISAPPTFMYGKELNVPQQRTWFKKGFEWLMECESKHTWVSFEPLAIDVTDILKEYEDFDGGKYPALDWAVIGAGSDGRKTYQPDELVFLKTLDVLSGCPIFYKGNLSRDLAVRNGGWREEFPDMGQTKV